MIIKIKMDIGVVGKPNVGKSTFFKALTMADVRIENYPFTTIDANVGVGHARVECACKRFEVTCSPRNSYCLGQNRFVPVKLIDVAGLVPGAHEGKGLGNKFLDDLIHADALIHIIDISGGTDEKGDASEGYDPEEDIKFLEQEIDLWFSSILKKNWGKIRSKVQYGGSDLIKELSKQLSGLKIIEHEIVEAIRHAALMDKTDWTDDDLYEFSTLLRKVSKPMVIAANKIDLDENGNFERIKGGYDVTPVCSAAELALRNASDSGFVEYIPGDGNFKIIKDMDEKQTRGLEFIRGILNKYGSTGVQNSINKAVFDVLKMMVVYPVEDEHKLIDNRGNVLPDALLMPENSTAVDLAYKIHTDIGERFIGAIDCKTGRKIGREHVLENGDVISILTRK